MLAGVFEELFGAHRGLGVPSSPIVTRPARWVGKVSECLALASPACTCAFGECARLRGGTVPNYALKNTFITSKHQNIIIEALLNYLSQDATRHSAPVELYTFHTCGAIFYTLGIPSLCELRSVLGSLAVLKLSGLLLAIRAWRITSRMGHA